MQPHHDNQDVAIFWDYENCHGPSSISGYEVVKSIRSVAHKFGSVKLFKAYLELSEQAMSPRLLGLRSELQSSGVSLTDCPHNGRKNVADQMIIVDMLTYAIDRPAPATLILISGDRDFAYAASVLRLRRYSVVIISLSTPGAHPSLKAQASACLDWNIDIMGRFEDQPMSQRSELGGSDDVGKSTSLGSRQHSDTATDALLAPSPQKRDVKSVGGQGNRHRRDNSVSRSLQNPESAEKASQTFGPIIMKTPVLEKASLTPSLSGAGQLPVYRDILDSSPRSIGSVTAIPAPGRLHSTISVLTPPSTVKLNTLSSMPTPSQMTVPDVIPPSKETISRAELLILEDIKSPSNELPRTAPPIKSLPRLTTPVGPAPHYVQHLEHPPDDSPSDERLEAFNTLVNYLRECLKQGKVQVPRFSAACELVSAGIHIQAGVSTFQEFLALAERHMLIKQGGSSVNAWISLLPPWHSDNVLTGLPSSLRQTSSYHPSGWGPVGLPARTYSMTYSVPTPQSAPPSLPPWSPTTGNASEDYTRPEQVDYPDPYQNTPEPRNAMVDHMENAPTAPVNGPSSFKLSADSAAFEPVALSCTPLTEGPEPPPMEPPTAPQQQVDMAPKFKPLVEILQRHRTKGVSRPTRSSVATELMSRNKMTYKEAGVKSFREYTALAVKERIVEMGGLEADAWISLNPQVAG